MKRGRGVEEKRGDEDIWAKGGVEEKRWDGDIWMREGVDERRSGRRGEMGTRYREERRNGRREEVGRRHVDERRERSGRSEARGGTSIRRRSEPEGERRWRRRNVGNGGGARDTGGRRNKGRRQEIGNEGRRATGDPEFRSLVRALHAFLKLFHYTVEAEDGREGPPGRLTRLAAQAKKVQLAFQSARTECRLQDNTNEWLQNGLTILEEHYQGALRRASREVVGSLGVDWKVAWQVAVKWTQRRYRKMKERTVQRAWRVVKAIMSRRKPEGEAGEGTSGDTSPRKNRNRNRDSRSRRKGSKRSP